MFVIHENFKEFVEELQAREKTIPVYMKIVTHTDAKNNILSAEVLMQFPDAAPGLYHTCHYTDGIKAVKLVSMGAFNIIADDKARDAETKRYNDILNMFDDGVRAEFENAKKLFGELGYNNIKDCYVVSG
jgi:hypothetical protein